MVFQLVSKGFQVHVQCRFAVFLFTSMYLFFAFKDFLLSLVAVLVFVFQAIVLDKAQVQVKTRFVQVDMVVGTDDVRAEVEWAINTCRDKASLVFFTSNTLTPDVPLENIQMLWDNVINSTW